MIKIFESEDGSYNKLNIVDDNNVLVGFDYSQCCCEDFGYFFSSINLLDDIEPYTVLVDDGCSNEIEDMLSELIDLNEYSFDTSYFKEFSLSDRYDYCFGLFRLTNGSNYKYLYLYNFHNGYYGHGFEMENNGNIFYRGSL